MERGVDRMCSEVHERWSMCCAARLIVSADDFLQSCSSAPACTVNYCEPSINKGGGANRVSNQRFRMLGIKSRDGVRNCIERLLSALSQRFEYIAPTARAKQHCRKTSLS